MTVRPLAAALLAAAALGVAACGADGETPAASGASRREDDKLRAAQARSSPSACARTGVDVPDPGTDGRRRSGSAPTAASRRRSSRRRPRRARSTARTSGRSSPRPSRRSSRSGARARALHARARDRLPRPDVLGRRRRADPARARQRLDPEDPDFKAAQEACGGPDGRRRPAGVVEVRRADRDRAAACSPPRRSPAASPCSAATTTRAPRPPRAPPPARRRRSSGATWSTATSVDGTLGYADAGTLVAGAAGTLTALRAPGAVVRRGRVALRGRRRAGRVPALRARCRPGATSTPWMEDGDDIRQLERNLRALGHDPTATSTVDDEWTRRRPPRCERFQDGARAGRRTARSRRARSCSCPGRRGSARPRPPSARARRPGASWPPCPRPRGASPSTSPRRASGSRARATP